MELKTKTQIAAYSLGCASIGGSLFAVGGFVLGVAGFICSFCCKDKRSLWLNLIGIVLSIVNSILGIWAVEMGWV